MKKQAFLIGFLRLVCILIGIQSVFSQESAAQKDGFGEMSFAVNLNKSEYLPLEPIVATFKFSNQTNSTLKTIKPNYANDLILRLNDNGKIRNYGDLFGYTVDGISFPEVFQPGALNEESGIIRDQLNYIFPTIGNYQVQFVLNRNGIEKVYTSNILIKEPVGIDKDAFDYLMSYSNTTYGEHIFSWNDITKSQPGRNLLQEFVDKYSQSVYGEYAMYRLGNYYLYNTQDFDRANQEFEKLRSASSPVLAKAANDSIEIIKGKKTAFQKMSHPILHNKTLSNEKV